MQMSMSLTTDKTGPFQDGRTTYAPKTCGFLPLHLYEGPELERALAVVNEINSMAMSAMQIGKSRTGLIEKMGLRDMLDAVEIVEAWNDRPKTNGESHSMALVPAERLTAAAYTLLNFKGCGGDTDKDDDHIVVRIDARHWGDDIAHWLLVGARTVAELEADDEEDT